MCTLVECAHTWLLGIESGLIGRAVEVWFENGLMAANRGFMFSMPYIPPTNNYRAGLTQQFYPSLLLPTRHTLTFPSRAILHPNQPRQFRHIRMINRILHTIHILTLAI